MAPIKTPSSRLLAMFLQEHAQPGFHPFLMEKGMPHNKLEIQNCKMKIIAKSSVLALILFLAWPKNSPYLASCH